jgi:hypothetical protein
MYSISPNNDAIHVHCNTFVLNIILSCCSATIITAYLMRTEQKSLEGLNISVSNRMCNVLIFLFVCCLSY